MQSQGKSMMARTKTLNNPKFVIGDLVHIPSNVMLWAPTGDYSLNTESPAAGVVVDESSHLVTVFVNGRRMNANKNHVYPYKEVTNEGN